MASKQKWGDHPDEEEYDENDSKIDQPIRLETQPDADGIKTVTEITTDPKTGVRTKIVSKVKVVQKRIRVNKHVLERRSLPKFGDCAGQPAGRENNITYVSHETIYLDLSGKSREEQEYDPLKKLKEGSESIVVCRLCGETGHWTLKCPKRDQISVKGVDPAPGPAARAAAAAASSGPGGKGVDGKYVPPSRRDGGGDAGGPQGGGRGRDFARDDTAALRVTNISEDTTEDDLRELFRKFGRTKRIYLAKDRHKGQSRGFAFVNYEMREDAERAIQELDGHPYDNLILHVEWAKPREQSEQPPSAAAVQQAQRRRF